MKSQNLDSENNLHGRLKIVMTILWSGVVGTVAVNFLLRLIPMVHTILWPTTHLEIPLWVGFVLIQIWLPSAVIEAIVTAWDPYKYTQDENRAVVATRLKTGDAILIGLLAPFVLGMELLNMVLGNRSRIRKII